MDKKSVLNFLLKARENTYAGGKGKTEAILPGSVQMEFKEKNLLYRDIYNIGSGIFIGIETIYESGKPVFSMSYFGDFSKLTEEETDRILRSALIKFKNKTRLWKDVAWKKSPYEYIYKSNFGENIDKFGGTEVIKKGKNKVYFFNCYGGCIGQ